MYEKLTAFVEQNDSFILTTHDPADADGLGAQKVFACILRKKNKHFRIINASQVPGPFRFMDTDGSVEQWDKDKHGELPEQSALLMLDTADLHNTGHMRDAICRAREVFAFDHHEPGANSSFRGICDSTAASTSEMAVEFAKELDLPLDLQTACAAYAGIAYDTGFFAYPKTGPRTFRAALSLLELGVNPDDAYRQLHESASVGALLLQKAALASLTLHCDNRVAVQILRRGDFIETGALPEDTDGLVNIPIRARDVLVSFMIKETPDGKIRCSLRSKGKNNDTKIAQDLGGGGHVNAAGFKSSTDIDQTMAVAMVMISKHLEKFSAGCG
jgi:phosphoesterase RecJ-like protein